VNRSTGGLRSGWYRWPGGVNEARSQSDVTGKDLRLLPNSGRGTMPHYARS